MSNADERSGRRPCLPVLETPRQPNSGQAGTPAPTKSRVWLWFVAAFLIQAAAWTAWFVIASQHKVAEVPLATTR